MCDDAAQRGRLAYSLSKGRFERIGVPNMLGFIPLIYYTVEYEYRYRYPILWVTFLLGSLLITASVQRANIFLSGGLKSAASDFQIPHA